MAASSGTNAAFSTDFSKFPCLTFSDVEAFISHHNQNDISLKGYKYFTEEGYIHDVKLSYDDTSAMVSAKCYCSMKKNNRPHDLRVTINISSKDICAECKCVAGRGGCCNHVIGLLYYLAHFKTLGRPILPDDLSCTSMKERWSIPRGRKVGNQEVQNVLVKRIQPRADYSRFIKSTLYSPCRQYPVLDCSHYINFKPKPLIATVCPEVLDRSSAQFIPTKYGAAVKVSVISYQQRLSSDYLINNYAWTAFLDLPLVGAEARFENRVPVCLQQDKLALLESLNRSRSDSISVEQRTRAHSQSDYWKVLHKKRITASKFGRVLKRTGNFESLYKQICPSKHIVTAPMRRGIELESHAAYIYASKAKNSRVNLFPSGLVIHPKCPWLGCTPDRKVLLLDDDHDMSPIGLLEIKVVKEGVLDFDNVAYVNKDSGVLKLSRNHDYHYQVQCQLALTGLEWCDFFSYINDTTYFCERISFDPSFFQSAKDNVDAYFFPGCNQSD